MIGSSLQLKTPLIANNRKWLILLLFLYIQVSFVSTTTFAARIFRRRYPIRGGETMLEKATTSDDRKGIKIVFSDLDGTLIHYPDKSPKLEKGNTLIKLPPSSTGLRGVLSSKTLTLVKDIRETGVPFVLVTGMRTPTLLNRMPFLPRADAYCAEAGGRIFYPTDDLDSAEYIVEPKSYPGCDDEDIKPFGLVEDHDWRELMEQAAGEFGEHSLNDLASNPTKCLAKLEERDGLLWDFARGLQNKGFVLDTKGYSACFRVNMKQQKDMKAEKDFQTLLDHDLVPPLEGISSSVNLNCVDYYPTMSGKKNCCQYLAAKFIDEEKPEKVLSLRAACLCDDDNDLEMALACHHAYIPTVTSSSLAEIIEEHPQHFTKTFEKGSLHLAEPISTEDALSLVLEQVRGPTGTEATKGDATQTKSEAAASAVVNT